MPEVPLAYLITFSAYGARLHGDARGSVDRRRNLPGTPTQGYDERRWEGERAQLKGQPVSFDERARECIAFTIREVATHRSWTVHALNVRTNHVHAVVTAASEPEPVMDTFKRWGTRRLREAGLMPADGDVWSRHGSTRWIWSAESLADVVDYVHFGQGGWIEGCGAPPTTARARGAADPHVGLCSQCGHARAVKNDRGSTFWLCAASATDPGLRKYPQLPVRRCHGYAEKPG